jgi:hypothetical protein
MPNNYLPHKIDLDRTSHEWAAKFAAAQPSIAKGRKVYLNTLAVCAVRQYLSCVCELDLDLSQSDSWQTEFQAISNIADLVIPNVGKIECLVVLPGATDLQIPAALIGDRIGYVIVKISDDLNSVELLGFIDRSDTESIALDVDRFQPLDDLLDLIYTTQITNLREFLVGKFGMSWEPIENSIDRSGVLGETLRQQEFALRNTLNLPTNTSYDRLHEFIASKMINLRANIANIPLLILIGLGEELDGRIKVRVRLHAAGGVPMLPANLKLTLQSEHGRVLSEIQYSEAMNFIQLQSFKLEAGTQFKIRVALDNSSFTESFVA